MKKYLSKISIGLVALFLFSSCEEDIVNFNEANYKAYAGFSRSLMNLPVLEATASSTLVKVDVSSVSDVDRTIEVEADASSTALPAQYTIDAASLVIPAHSNSGYIKITGNYAAFQQGITYSLVLTLLKVGDAVLNKQATKVRVNMYSTCPLDLAAVATAYSGTSYANSFDPADEVTTFTPTVTRIGDTNAFSFDTLWGQDFIATIYGNSGLSGQYIYPGTVTINPEDYSITITTLDPNLPGGTGFYDPCTNTFVYSLTQTLIGEDKQVSSVNVIVKKAN